MLDDCIQLRLIGAVCPPVVELVMCFVIRVLAGHVDGNPLAVGLVGSGSGGPSELTSKVDDASVMYGLSKCSFWLLQMV